MIGYWSLVSARFRALLQYRAAAIAGFGTQLFWGLIRVMIFEAFYLSSAASQPMPLEDVTTYIWLGQAFLVFLPWNVDRDIQAIIRSGAVSYELLRPLDLYWAWFSRAIALRSAPALLRCVPMLVIAGAFFGLQPPDSWGSAAAFLFAMLGALLLSAAITTLLNISLLWTISGDGASTLGPAAVIIFSGMVIPIPLFPDWAQPIFRALPFSGLVDMPFRVYSGHIPLGQLPVYLAHQLGWTLTLILFGKWVLSRGVRRMVVQGG